MNRMLAAAALGAFIAAMVMIALSSTGSNSSSSPPVTTLRTTTVTKTRPTTTTAPTKPVSIELAAVGAYDPEGDGHENDAAVVNAVDGNPASFWSTEHYTHGFFKKGVGIVLDAGRRRPIGRVVVGTDGAGSRAEIQLGDNPGGPFRPVSQNKALDRSTTFALKKGATGRYVLVWVTALPSAIGEAHVTEVRAFSG
jgi:hypothetical protein